MTKEDAWRKAKGYLYDALDGEEADEIIKALEYPCEDAVSRKKVINQIFYSTDNNGDVVLGSALRERIAGLPPVTPQVIDKYKGENKESATVAKFHDFYLEDRETWPPADEEILIKKPVGDNFLAYLVYDDGEDGGWGFYSKDGDFIADLDEIDAWMPIPQHERDKNYIPVWVKYLTSDIDDPGLEEEKDR